MFVATIIGNLGADPEARYSAKGSLYVTMRVAVNQRRKARDSEEYEEHTDWFRVRIMGRQAEYAQRAEKGDRVCVIGAVTTGKYETNDGETRFSLDIFADEVKLLGRASAERREDDGYADDDQPAPAQRSATPARSNGGGNARQQQRRSAPADASADLEDLPF